MLYDEEHTKKHANAQRRQKIMVVIYLLAFGFLVGMLFFKYVL